ncbi:MAG TPA: 50S ribosomal protein L6 [Candidatus Paceibacterota bacterium]|nr:50S ribosomal protein L6 [Candidatus Paceibacterota bacterium]
MSRIGKKPIEIPQGVEIQVQGQKVNVKGPKGELSREFRPELKIEKQEHEVIITPVNSERETRALWGLTRTLLANMIQGVTQGFEKRLELEGVGYRASAEGDSLALQIGFSHPVKMKAPAQTTVSVEKNVITIGGIDKEQVGQFAARIRKVRPPEPYKGKGIRYEGETIRRKLGKKAAGATAA